MIWSDSDQATTILFWNIRKKDLAEQIARLVMPYSVDVILLAESDYWMDSQKFLGRVNQELIASPNFRNDKIFVDNSHRLSNKRVQVFSRFGSYNWLCLSDQRKYAIWRLITRSNNSLLIATAHFPSAQSDEEDGQRLTAGLLRQDLERVEVLYEGKTYNGKRQDAAYSIVIGDLNASPFAPGIVGAYGLHAVGSRMEALKGGRQVDKTFIRYLYNPMWQFLSAEDVDDGHGNYLVRNKKEVMRTVPGTYYYDKRSVKPVWYGWYILDQVLLRPSLLEHFDNQQVIIPRSDGLNPFVTLGERRPSISDHLPIIFRVNV